MAYTRHMPDSDPSIPSEPSLPELLVSLEKYGASVARKDRVQNAYRATFNKDAAITTVRIVLEDYSGADLVITNLTTLPEIEKGKGHGSAAIQSIILWAHENNLNNIRAVQVQAHNESFWERNGFVRCEEPNPCKDYVYRGA